MKLKLPNNHDKDLSTLIHFILREKNVWFYFYNLPSLIMECSTDLSAFGLLFQFLCWAFRFFNAVFLSSAFIFLTLLPIDLLSLLWSKPIIAWNKINSCMMGNFLWFFCRLQIFFKINLFKNFFQEHYQSVKQFGSRLNSLSDLYSPMYIISNTLYSDGFSHTYWYNNYKIIHFAV